MTDFHVGDQVVCCLCQPPPSRPPVTVMVGTSYGGQREVAADSIMDILKANGIVAINKLPNGKYEIRERCDSYFYAEIDRSQLMRLADEIRELGKG